MHSNDDREVGCQIEALPMRRSLHLGARGLSCAAKYGLPVVHKFHQANYTRRSDGH